MNKKITVVLFIGVIALISMGFSSHYPESALSKGSELVIIKGQAFNNGVDRYWDKVTFGLAGLNPDQYEVTSVEIFDQRGRYVGHTDRVNLLSSDRNGTSWYSINLNRFDIKKDFSIEIHVVTFSDSVLGDVTTLYRINAEASPIEPDETVLILKYP